MDRRSSVSARPGRASRAIRFVWLGLSGFACVPADPPASYTSGGSGEEGIPPVEDDEGADIPEETGSGTTEPLPSVRLDIGGASFGKFDIDPDSMDCPDVSVAITPTIPTVLLLLDQSYSMTINFGAGTNRWDAVYDTLFDPQEGVVYMLHDRVRFGMTL